MQTYQGSCHCGSVQFEVDTILDRITECNCSICRKKGILHHRVHPEHFRLLSGQETLGIYQFGKNIAKHHFCTRCGIHVYSRPRAAPDLYTINVRCLDNFDLTGSAVEITQFDGRNWEKNASSLK